MIIEERKILRNNILREVYNYFFELKGEAKKSKLNLEHQVDCEIFLAALYLAEKGLITLKSIGSNGEFNMKITANGIDLVENVLGIEPEV